jgi:hypothetical protein
VICPNCREDNAPSFRFCGMCGSSLEPKRKAGAAGLDPLSAFPSPLPPPKAPPRTASQPDPVPSMVMAGATASVSQHVPPISGPSMLGLDGPAATQRGVIEADRSQSSERDLNEPSLDSLRERSFSGLDSFMEPEPPNTGLRRIMLLLVLLVALGGAGWWTYTNYIGAMEGRKPEVATTTPSGSATENTPSQPAPQNAAPTQDNNPAVPPAPSAQTPEPASGNASTAADATPTKTPDAAANPAAETKTTASPPNASPAAEPSSATRQSRFQSPPKRQPAASAAKEPDVRSASSKTANVRSANVHPPNVQPANLSSTTGADTGDADFRRGEASLYGRGAAGNCDQAVKSLKAASAKSNAKARSTFGTMYATGHCVPRDLPTSYLWFALALKVDPNNQILEKDLNAIWNQMTPPERQMATRMKE